MLTCVLSGAALFSVPWPVLCVLCDARSQHFVAMLGFSII